MALIRVAGHDSTFHADHFGRAIAARTNRLCLVKFYRLPVVDIRTECPLDRINIGAKAVR